MAKVTSVSHSRKRKEIIGWEKALEVFLFFKRAQGVSNTTSNDYSQHLTRFFNRFPECWESGNVKMAAMEYMSDDIKPATFNLRLIYLKAFFNWCVSEQLVITQNPLQEFKKRKAEPRIVEINEDALQRLLALPDRTTYAVVLDYALIMFMLDTGIRPKEALSLIEDKFDLERLTVTVPADISKTRTTRILPILPPTAEAIHKLITVRHPVWGQETPVFCSNEGKLLNRHTWGDRLEMYSNQLGVKIFPYALRHCFALMYLRNGGHVFGLQKMLGHSDMNMTRRYVNMTGHDLQEAHKKASL